MATQLYLSGVSAITGGVLDLNGANIQLLPGWRPRVAKRRRGVLGGKRHEDVVESIPLRVFGASAADCVQFLELLAAAMDQARDWKDGAAVDAVILNYAIDGTTLASALQTAVLGTPLDAADILSLPVTFNQNLQVFEVNPVTLPVERRGEWLGDEESDNSATVDNGDVMTVDLTATTQPSPTVLRLGEFDQAGPNETWGGYLLLAESSDDIVIINAEVVAGTTDYTSVVDSTNLARNTNVLRFTPTATTYRATNITSVFTINESVRMIGAFINARNTSSDYRFNVVLEYGQYLTIESFSGIDSRPFVIPAGASDPAWYFIGITNLRTELKSVRVEAQAESLTGSPTLEIDTVVLVDMSSVRVVALSEVSAMANWSNGDTEIVIDHSILERPAPRVYTKKVADSSYSLAGIYYTGNALLHTSSATLTALYLSTGGNDPRHWRRSDNAGAVMELYAGATRRPAYLVPR
jgi:hypothetical protein